MKRMYKPTNNPVWKEDLIMCPSQCFCFFIAEGKRYCIYLRWRHGDPWTAQLLPEDKENETCYYLYWEWLEVGNYTHDDYKELEKECIKVVTKRFKDIQWMEESK